MRCLKQRYHDASSACCDEWREMYLAENFEWAVSWRWQQEGLRVVEFESGEWTPLRGFAALKTLCFGLLLCTGGKGVTV